MNTTSRGPQKIVLLTDFGWQDTYVGVMKGVISQIAPRADILDLTHAIPQGDLKETAYKLWQSVRYFPDGTIFVIVVDPGVGTERRAIGLSWQGYQLIAPDNGVLTYLLAQAPADRAHELTNPDFQHHPVSTTFHGRDIFAPAGGHLAAGRRLEDFGESLEQLVRLELPHLSRISGAELEGEVIHVDGFGNAITSIGRLKEESDRLYLSPWLNQIEPETFPNSARAVLPSGISLSLSETFGAVPLDEPVVYLGSEQMLEIAINGGSAAAELGLTIGDSIKLRFRG